MNSGTVETLPERLPSLDGWRALSIILVLGSHAPRVDDFPEKYRQLSEATFDGALGVRFFFIISGFIITWLLIKESVDTKMVNFKRFYIRRSLRIFPVYYFYLIIVFILQLFTHYHQSALAWFQNISFSTGYQFPSTQYSWTTGHLWSIAVEEQFYIVWPIMFYFFRNNFKQAIILLLTPILLAPFFRVIDYVNNENQGFGWLFPTPQFLSCFDSLATGCICAFFYFKYTCTIHSFYLKNKFILFTLGFLLILIPAILQKQYICGFFTVPFANTSQNLGFAILLLQSIVSPHSIPYNILNKKIMKFIGMLSFSIYIWQQLFTTPSSAFLNQEIYFLKFPWFLGCVFLISIISYYLIEKPFLVLRSKYRITN